MWSPERYLATRSIITSRRPGLKLAHRRIFSPRLNKPIVYVADSDFQIGRTVRLLEGRDATLIANGFMVFVSLEAVKVLAAVGIDSAVMNMHTIKPLDGSLVGAIPEYKATLRGAPPQLTIVLPDDFEPSVEHRYLLEKDGLMGARIAERVLASLGR